MTPIPPGTERALIVCPTWIGDTVMATPVLRAMRRALPEARLTALVRPGLDDLLAGLPFVDDVLVAPNRGVLGPLRTAALMRHTGCEVGLLLPNSYRWALSLRLAGVPRRVGYRRDGRGPLLTHGLDPPRQRPIAAIQLYARLAEWALGIEPIDRRLELAVSERDEEAAGELLRGVEGRFVVLNPGANLPAKRWPADRFAALAAILHARHGLSVVVSGAPGERDVLDALIAAAPPQVPIVDLAARGIRICALKAVLRRAALLVTNDTGPRHIAAALGTPVVSLFGPTDHRWTTLEAARERVLLAEPFLPENLLADDHRRACAIERIPVADVVTAAEQLLRGE